MPHWYVRAPDHLGDGVLALPLLEALATRARLTVAAPAWGQGLYSGMASVVARGTVPPDAEVAVLIKPAFRAYWEARKVPRRVGWPTDHRRLGLTDVVPLRSVHRMEQMADLGGPLGVRVEGLPTVRVPMGSEGGVVLLPLSASGRTVEWQGFRALADALVQQGHRVRFAAGPGETARLAEVAGPHALLPELPVGGLAMELAAAEAVVGNDSGLTHLAAAARRGSGRPVGSVIGVVGSTCPTQTGAPGATWVEGPRPSCAPCYSKRCSADLACLQVPVEAVLAAVLAVLGEGSA